MTRLELARKRVTAADFAKPVMSEDAEYIMRVAFEAARKDQEELLKKAGMTK